MVPRFSSSVFAVIDNPSISVSPAATVYEKTSEVEPLPDVYVANLLVRPASAIRGVPVTVTTSENTTVTDTVSPAM